MLKSPIARPVSVDSDLEGFMKSDIALQYCQKMTHQAGPKMETNLAQALIFLWNSI
jgi:hypothetical protein